MPPDSFPGFHPEHLNTPRLVADSAGTTVWKWDQAEPFGVTVPDENPSGLGAFDLPLRFPGQYADKETSLAYNYFRDYDAAIGRYAQSDPIGLDGGLNTFAYVSANPLAAFDSEGLAAWLVKLCAKGYQKLRRLGDKEAVVKAKEGAQIYVDGGRSEATSLAKRASKGQKPLKHTEGHPPYNNPHTHPGPHPGNGHIFYSIAAALTFAHYAEGCGCIAEEVAPIVDLFNPLSIPHEIINLMNGQNEEK